MYWIVSQDKKIRKRVFWSFPTGRGFCQFFHIFKDIDFQNLLTSISLFLVFAVFAKYHYFGSTVVPGLCKLIHISLVWYVPTLHATNDSLCERRCPIRLTKSALLIFNSGGQIKLKNNVLYWIKVRSLPTHVRHLLLTSELEWWSKRAKLLTAGKSC